MTIPEWRPAGSTRHDTMADRPIRTSCPAHALAPFIALGLWQERSSPIWPLTPRLKAGVVQEELHSNGLSGVTHTSREARIRRGRHSGKTQEVKDRRETHIGRGLRSQQRAPARFAIERRRWSEPRAHAAAEQFPATRG